MVKAIIKLKDGTEVSVEGTPEEVAKTKNSLLETEKETKLYKIKQKKKGPLHHILELKSENFFDKPRTISEIKQKLEEKTYYYPLTSISPALIRLYRQGELGRLKKDGKWIWVKR
jgi:hypothetical protein